MGWSPSLPRQFLWLDDKGRERHDWWPMEYERKGPREAVITFQTLQDDGVRPVIPARFLFYSLIRTTTEIPFDFRDIPLP